jgi:hypothetical protein
MSAASTVLPPVFVNASVSDNWGQHEKQGVDLAGGFRTGRIRSLRLLGWVSSGEVDSRWSTESGLGTNCELFLWRLASSKEQLKTGSNSYLEDLSGTFPDNIPSVGNNVWSAA